MCAHEVSPLFDITTVPAKIQHRHPSQMGTDPREKFALWWVAGLDIPTLDENHQDNEMKMDVSLYKSGAEFLSPTGAMGPRTSW